ncbi:MAG TPA: LacI family DNA-binding transcriptional regulator [Microlunatus sp.]|nr:LacI family DNA-binding transcriptional regulator [Microlunatus sp.]
MTHGGPSEGRGRRLEPSARSALAEPAEICSDDVTAQPMAVEVHHPSNRDHPGLPHQAHRDRNGERLSGGPDPEGDLPRLDDPGQLPAGEGTAGRCAPRTSPSRSPRPTLAEIADAAGVSVATVSKVLNDHTDVAEQTRRRIQQLLRESAYQPTRRSARRSTESTDRLIRCLSRSGRTPTRAPCSTGWPPRRRSRATRA